MGGKEEGAPAAGGGDPRDPEAPQDRNVLILTFRQRGGGHFVVRLGCKNDASLLNWYDGLQVSTYLLTHLLTYLLAYLLTAQLVLTYLPAQLVRWAAGGARLPYGLAPLHDAGK